MSHTASLKKTALADGLAMARFSKTSVGFSTSRKISKGDIARAMIETTGSLLGGAMLSLLFVADSSHYSYLALIDFNTIYRPAHMIAGTGLNNSTILMRTLYRHG
ncbi:MAG: hypothetical protein V3S70_07905 [Gammaproteobacteria bacterium]